MKSFFPFIITIFFAMVHYLAYTRVISRLHVSIRTKRVLKYLLILNVFVIMGYLLSRYTLSPPKYLYFLLSLGIGVGFVLFVGTILYEVLHLLQHYTPFDEEKRYFFKRTTDIGFLALGSAYIAAATLEGSKEPVVKYVDVKQNRFNGKSYTIAQISDMHIGGLIDREFVSKSVQMINKLNPDIIVITGDLSDAHVNEIKEAIDELHHLKSRYGTYYIVRNHEYFHSLEDTIAHLKTLNIHVLENSSVKIEDFYIAGVYDLFGYRFGSYLPDIGQAMKNIPRDASTLLLAHQPKYVEYLEGFTPSLILSGHTHGGQIWPFEYLVRLAQPYIAGLYSLDSNRHIYVNSGIGFWGPPMRLGSQAEITCITWS
ncbi:MAG: metallophosphoesterase [Epsilonproteobacteria bacterium]|nr:metallophosphoesterase [Campylobacterota bacterium]